MSDAREKSVDASGTAHGAASRQRGPVTLAEMTAGLVWPTLLRAPALAVQPPRVLLALFTLGVIALVSWAFDGILAWGGAEALAFPLIDQMTAALALFAEAAVQLRFVDATEALFHSVIGAPLAQCAERPVGCAALALLVIPVWMIGGGAICRMVAVDVAGRLNLTTADALSFSLRSAPSLIGAAAIPIVAMGAVALALRVFGWALLSISVVDVLGGVLYGLMLLAGFALSMLVIGFAAGQALLAPAVVAEGADAMDAVQRAYAYVIGRPGRAILYATAALVQGAIVYTLARLFVRGSLSVTSQLVTSWLGEDRANSLRVVSEEQPLAGWFMHEWEQLVWTIFAAFVVSLYFSSSTILYMLLRRVNDEQDLREVWVEAEPQA